MSLYLQKSDELLKTLSNPGTGKKETTNETEQTSPGADKEGQSCDMEQDKQDQQNIRDQSSPKLPGIHGYEDDPESETATDENKDQQEIPKIRIDSVESEETSSTSDQKSENESSSSENSKSENGSVSSEGSSLSSLCEAMQDGAQVAGSSGDSSRSATPTNDVSLVVSFDILSCHLFDVWLLGIFSHWNFD